MGVLSNVRTLVMVCVLLASAWPAVAQEPARLQETPHPLGRLRFGRLTLTPNVTLAQIGIDTNVFDLTGTERRPADFTMTLIPELEARVATPRFDLRATNKISYLYYQRASDQRAASPGIDLSLDLRASSHLTLYSKGVIAYSKERSGFEIDARERKLSSSEQFGVRFAGRRVELDVHGSYADIAYDQDARFLNIKLSETLDHTTRGTGATFTYRLSPYTSIVTTAGGQVDRFGHDQARDTDSVRGSVGMKFNPRAMIAGDASIGFRLINPRSAVTPGFSVLTPRVGLSYRLHDILSVAVGAEQDVEYSFYGDRPYFQYRLYEASVRQGLFRGIDVVAGTQVTTLEYHRFLVPGEPRQSPPRDVLRLLTGSVGFSATRAMRIGWYVQEWRRLSSDRAYQSFRTGLELSVGKTNISPRGVFLSGPSR